MLDGQLKTNLIIALAGAAMADGIGTFLDGDVHQSLGNTGTGMGSAQQVLLIHRAGLEAGDDVIVHILVGQIQHIQLAGAGLQRLFFQTLQLVRLTHITGNGDDLTVIIVFLQPGDDDGCIETAGIGEDDFFDVFFIHGKSLQMLNMHGLYTPVLEKSTFYA